MSIIDSIEKLIQAYEAELRRNPDFARPGKLRQGCISFISDHKLSEEELDDLWMKTFGHT